MSSERVRDVLADDLMSLTLPDQAKEVLAKHGAESVEALAFAVEAGRVLEKEAAEERSREAAAALPPPPATTLDGLSPPPRKAETKRETYQRLTGTERSVYFQLHKAEIEREEKIR